MLENYRTNKGSLDFKEKALFLGILAVVLLGTLLWYNHSHRPADVTPQSLFTDTFTDPLDSVTQLEGEVDNSYGYDSWIRFRSITPVHLRQESEFKPTVAEVGRHWFATKWPDDQSLRDSASSYKFFEWTVHDVGKVIQCWFLVNNKQHRYFYRRRSI